MNKIKASDISLHHKDGLVVNIMEGIKKSNTIIKQTPLKMKRIRFKAGKFNNQIKLLPTIIISHHPRIYKHLFDKSFALEFHWLNFAAGMNVILKFMDGSNQKNISGEGGG